jgi:hypothetical protein
MLATSNLSANQVAQRLHAIQTEFQLVTEALPARRHLNVRLPRRLKRAAQIEKASVNSALLGVCLLPKVTL